MQLNKQLEQKVNERTTDLSIAIDELESFSYSVSHDLRTPLRHIVAFTALVKDALGKQDIELVNQYLEKVSIASKKMGQLIDDLLAFAKISRSEMKQEIVSLNQLLEEIINELEELQDDRKIDWNIKGMLLTSL